MAIGMMDMITGMKDKVAAGIVLQFARQSLVFQKISFENIDSFWMKAWQLESVTDAVSRRIGTAYSETKDKFTELQEGIYLMGGQVDIDRALRLPGQKEIDAYTENLKLQSERFRYGFMEAYVNGDRSVDPDLFNGLAQRVEAQGGDQVIAAGGLDLSASSANRQTFLDYIQQAMFEVADGKPDMILSSKQGCWQLERVARREGLLTTSKDAFDRDVKSFMGVQIEWAGTKGDQSTEIIGSAETAAGARSGGANTSFYFTRFGMPYVQGLQMHEPKRIFDDICDDGVTHRVVFEWPVGLAAFHKKSIVRLRGVTPIS